MVERSKSIRVQALDQLRGSIQSDGAILLGRQDHKEALDNLAAVTRIYHGARRTTIVYDLAAAYGVAVWGSTRIKKSSYYGKTVTRFVQELIERNQVDEQGNPIPLRIVTGAGLGLMEAAHYGAHRAKERGRYNGSKVAVINYGVPVKGVPLEVVNRYAVGPETSLEEHPEFPTRLQRMSDLTLGAYIAAGGWGTLYEALTAIQNKQTGHIEPGYLVLAHKFWQERIEGMYDLMYHARQRNRQVPLISEKDMKLVQFVKRPEEAVEEFTPSIRKWWEEIGSKVVWV